MTTVKKIWLLLTLFAPGLTAPAAAVTFTTDCPTEVVEGNVPKTKNAFALKLNQRSPFATSFKKYLHEESPQRRYADQIERDALILAYSIKPSIRAFQSNDQTIVKYDTDTRQLVIVIEDKIIFYDRVPTEDGDVFNALRKAKLRAQVAIDDVQPFSRLGLINHFANHGSEFDAADSSEYERRAIDFAENSTPRSMILEVEDRGRMRWVKMDFQTREIAIVAQDTHQMISFYVRERHPFHYFLRSVIKQQNR